jgi:NADH-quinone oxidoreductase subunit L
MTQHQLMLLLVFVTPLVGAILNGFLLRRVSWRVNMAVATAAIFIPFILSLVLFFGPVFHNNPVHLKLFDWIVLSRMTEGDIRLGFGLVADRLSGVMLLVITGVGSLIHLYSGQYMSHEQHVFRFFAYLNLFVFSMLALVLGSNMLTTFLGWEGVGLCSYLLIGYWFETEANAVAGMKAFIVNRIGDFGFLMAMFLGLMLFGTLDYQSFGGAKSMVDVITQLPPGWLASNQTLVTLFGLSVLLAVTGKSAQLPLFIWLPDAMAGPTPVSALIHAATMVTAGVYFMTRVSAALVLSPTAMMVIATVGGATALFAATIGFAQHDIKKVLAYSTVSQLGFMVLACGVGAFQFGVAHLVTHAFFKALLFLGAGSVIYAMHHEQDIRHMGGLMRKMPITGATFVIGTLAIIGFPLLSGFMSKDEILYNAWAGPFGHPLFWAMGALAAAGTSFYMVRLTQLVFFGTPRADAHHFDHVHENSWIITLPLVVLAILSVVGGIISVPTGLASMVGMLSLISAWLDPVLLPAQTIMAASHGIGHGESHALEFGLMGLSVVVMFVSAGIALRIYRVGPEGGEAIAARLGAFYRLVRDKWRVDELYALLVVEPLKKLADICFSWGDTVLVEGTVNGVPRLLRDATRIVSDLQTGRVRSYAKILFAGFSVLLFAVYYWGFA